MDSMYFQKKRKEENKYKPKEKWLDESDISIAAVILFTILFLIGLLVVATISSKESEIDCESIGGKYKVIDKTFAGKSVVEVYGCVK
ncbi:hypothetical protein QH639_19195 [Lysinibacillus sp. 1 U-2021]|uniref:hypothetical protein n=1 Tax=Lysinibacillus sp. 1 U-2021 TaxID=3039426 RepID=UPI002480685B|nr:hypothetical protein [Lysinibacillus sp. 1 U-2021]WGT37929.1 hypothetical protein QH639_19195 [Lysinibacillus sp. 1 U-2021]